MATTKEDISSWFDRGVKQGATHLIVAVDRFDHEDYPVYVQPDEDAREIVKTRFSGQNMQGAMEVYNLAKDKQEQLDRKRCFEY